METHEDDPTTEQPGDPWTSFHDELGGLGERLKDTYRKVASDGGPSDEEIKEAVATLVGAWDQVAESVSTALQDPDLRDKLKTAASSFAAAVGNTMSELGSELRGSGGSTSGSPGGEEE